MHVLFDLPFMLMILFEHLFSQLSSLQVFLHVYRLKFLEQYGNIIYVVIQLRILRCDIHVALYVI